MADAVTFSLPITCPQCAGPLELLQSRTTGRTSLAILSCEPCQWEFEVSMRIERHTRTDSWAQAEAAKKLAHKRNARQLALAP